MPQRGPAARPTAPPDTTTAPAAPTVAEAVATLFTRYDLDLNGSITAGEIQSVLDPDASATNLATRLASLVTAIDGNADGALSNAEVTAAVAALDTDADGLIERSDRTPGGTPDSTTIDIGALLRAHGPRGPGGPGGGEPGAGGAARTLAQVADGVFARVDADDNASISLSEALSYIDAHDRGADLAAEFTGLFNAADSNHDGSLSLAELTTAITTLDTNQNGSLDMADTALDQIGGLSVELAGVLTHGLGIGCGG